jgi:hypothetical protein
MKYWAGLFKEVDKEALENGVNTMLKIATSLLAKRNKEGELPIKDNDTNSQIFCQNQLWCEVELS